MMVDELSFLFCLNYFISTIRLYTFFFCFIDRFFLLRLLKAETLIFYLLIVTTRPILMYLFVIDISVGEYFFSILL